MWQLHARATQPGLHAVAALTHGDRSLSFAEVFAAWRDDRAFRDFWTDALRRLPFAAFCWECPALSAGRLDAQFECVFVESPLLAGSAPDPAPFGEHFRPGAATATFASLGGDALLVAPCPGPAGADFSHLRSFLATAGDERAAELWRAVGVALAARLGAAPTWLSTAGLGVAWLHVRLDARPKYYRHAPYARSS
jgi:hypothetical protein